MSLGLRVLTYQDFQPGQEGYDLFVEYQIYLESLGPTGSVSGLGVLSDAVAAKLKNAGAKTASQIVLDAKKTEGAG